MATHIVNFPDAHIQSTKITATTSVGIGTSGVDAYPLTIFKETEPEIRILEGTTQSSAARLYSNNSNLYIQTGTDFSAGSSGDIAFQTMDGQSTHMIIKSDGKVGVGTDSPGASLDISSTTGLILRNTSNKSTADERIGYIEFFNGETGGGNRMASAIEACVNTGSVNNNSDLRFKTTYDYNTPLVERMRIDRTGNVGIGTNSPSTPLQVHGGGTDVLGAIAAFKNSAHSNRVEIKDEQSSPYIPPGVWGLSGGGLALGTRFTGIRFYASENGATETERMFIKGNGNVGIGTDSPTRKLHVEGEIGLYGEKLLQAVIGYQHYTNTSNYQSTAATGGYFDCFNFNYNRKRSDSTIHIRAFLCPAQAFGDNGYRNTHRAVYVRLKFTENNSTVTYSHDVTDWERQDYGFHEYQRIVYIKHNNTFTGSTSGQNINIKAQVSSAGNSGTMGRWGINIWGGRSTVEVYETLY